MLCWPAGQGQGRAGGCAGTGACARVCVHGCMRVRACVCAYVCVLKESHHRSSACTAATWALGVAYA